MIYRQLNRKSPSYRQFSHTSLLMYKDERILRPCRFKDKYRVDIYLNFKRIQRKCRLSQIKRDCLGWRSRDSLRGGRVSAWLMSQRHTCVTVISWPSPQHSPRQTPSWEPSRTRTHWRPSPHKQPADTPGSCVQKTADVGCNILQNIWASGQMADHRAATPWYVEVLGVR